MNPEFVKAEFEAIVIELKEQDQRIKELEETVKELSEAFNSLSIAVATGIKY
jgi:cell division septum initiation protein DivIVA